MCRRINENVSGINKKVINNKTNANFLLMILADCLRIFFVKHIHKICALIIIHLHYN